MNYRVLLPLTVLALCACESTKSEAEPDARSGTSPSATSQPTSAPTSKPSSMPSSPVGKAMDATGYEKFGGAISAGLTVPVATALVAPESYTEKPVRLVGTVQSVCKKKGCWMRVGEGSEQLFVRFQDYGFFVPLDCEGREVVMEGSMQVSMMSVEDQKHYLEDAGKPEEAAKITEPKKEVMFMATGVAMKR